MATNIIPIEGNELYLIERILNRQQSKNLAHHFKRNDIELLVQREGLKYGLIQSLEKKKLIEYTGDYVYITDLAKKSLNNKFTKERNQIFKNIVKDYDYAFLEFMYNRNEPVSLLHFPTEFKDFSKIHMNTINGEEGVYLDWMDAVHKYIESPTIHGYELNQFGRQTFEQLRDEKQKVVSKENLEYQNLQTNNLLMVQQIIDYPKVKRERDTAFIVAIVELLVLIATMILTAKGKV